MCVVHVLAGGKRSAQRSVHALWGRWTRAGHTILFCDSGGNFITWHHFKENMYIYLYRQRVGDYKTPFLLLLFFFLFIG